MNAKKITDCCEKLCSSFTITNKEECTRILQSFFGEKEEEKTNITRGSSGSSSGCVSILKSGTNKNKPCGKTVKPGTNYCGSHTPKEESSVTPSTTPSVSVAPKTKKGGEIQTNLPIMDKIIQTRESFKVQKNKFDNFVHKETGFVFNPTTKKVIGKQNEEDGTILALSVKDIELCKENRWDFEIPTKVRTDKPEVTKRKVTVTVEDDDEDESDGEEEEL